MIRELAGPPDPPMGLFNDTRPHVHREILQPGDRLLCYTDGVTEARTPQGDLFGVDRLADAIIRTTATGMSAPEALRRLVHDLFREHDDSQADDATVVLTEWRPTTHVGALQDTLQTLPATTPWK
ncbi:PP2C family protein-serine/threonine phosphatase [Actinoallomurus soli]|uniref:PP2C family protein-serine/threonine phosphatase n=1 Tax=Actinoallomurus soli TaxID=2952535 RepID=UPI0020939316|nr:PP2C family protein-serine/threonine phosphatase [Actinoallomurus soli]MCO5975055.1 serine/threonine-protein phosphatase [Actinoallomurus soli]